ncbi:MAG: methionyl-tRNA formyltransferase [Sulfurospirillaceae bacterium]|nr:methionyl-tRNA formyltransferase [Sulfurospirillaceae bacterium]
MRIVFMGTPDYATEILEKLVNAENITVPLLITQKDKPVGRKQILTPPHIKKWALDNNIQIDIFQPDSLRNDGVKEKIISYHPDIIIVAAYGQILPKPILDIAPCINLHASILPHFRGASPIQSSILNNDKYTGVTAMQMEEGLDSGDILAFRYVESIDKRVDELFYELSTAAASLCLRVIEDFKFVKPIEQLNADATYCKKIKKENGLIENFENATQIYTKYRAFVPWPGIFTQNGLKIKELELLDEKTNNDEDGIIQNILEDGVVVTCKRGLLKIKKVQAPSKKEINVVDYIRGKRQNIGDKLV